jgi:DnaJ-domain-containing protein 1
LGRQQAVLQAAADPGEQGRSGLGADCTDADAVERHLQVAPTASALEIRDAYKHLISKYHPDKVDSLGQELKDLADKKSQEITAAYQEGMRARGDPP